MFRLSYKLSTVQMDYGSINYSVKYVTNVR